MAKEEQPLNQYQFIETLRQRVPALEKEVAELKAAKQQEPADFLKAMKEMEPAVKKEK